MMSMALVGLIVVVVIAVAAFYLQDQRNLSAQALARPQVPPEAAAGRASALDLNLPPAVNVATVHLLNGRDDVFILDVRSRAEYGAGHIPGATLIPLDQLVGRLGEVPREGNVIVACQTGRRSAQAVTILRSAGIANVHDLTGGLRAWNRAGFAVER